LVPDLKNFEGFFNTETAHFPTIWHMYLEKNDIDRIFMKILRQLFIWTRKTQLNSGSHREVCAPWIFLFAMYANCFSELSQNVSLFPIISFLFSVLVLYTMY